MIPFRIPPAALVLALASTPAMGEDPATWTTEQREHVAALVKLAAVKGKKTTPEQQALARANGLPVVLVQGEATFGRSRLEQDLHGCTIISFEILPDGKADQFELVKSEPPGVFDALALRMMLATEFERPAPAATGARPRLQKAVYTVIPMAPPKVYSRFNERNESDRRKRQAEMRAACEAQAP